MDQLSPPGAVSYTSNTTHVGDGTWDSTTDTFLLPNIQGLNFATMRYNGMGNRFAALSEYHGLIRGHGVIAVITFLFIIPISIFIPKFYFYNPRTALRTHIGLQIFTVILSTVVLILGYFAVGPERSLTNPHHGIGVALYVLVLVQTIGGAFVHRFERGKKRDYLPWTLMLHNWIGWGTALLGLAQIPIGLTLYGSPKWLFIVYSIIMAIYLFLFFIWTHDKHRRAAGYGDGGSYVTGTGTDLSERDHRHHRKGLWAIPAAVAGGLGINALRRRRSRERHERSDSRTGALDSARNSRVADRSQVTEKFSDSSYSQDEREGHGTTMRDRVLGTGAGLGALAGIRSIRDRISGRGRDEESDRGSIRPPLGGSVAAPRNEYATTNSRGLPVGSSRGVPPQDPSLEQFDRLEAGIPIEDQTLPNAHPAWRSIEAQEAAQARGMQQKSAVSRQTEGSYDSYDSREGGGFLSAVGLGGVSEWWRRRRERKEQARVDAEQQRERENARLYRRREDQPFNTEFGTPTRGAGADMASPPAMRNGSPPIQPVPPPMPDSPAGGRGVTFQPPSTGGGQSYSIPPPPRSINNYNVNSNNRSVDVAPPPPAHSTPPRASPSYPPSSMGYPQPSAPPQSAPPPPPQPQFNNRIDNQNITSYPPRAPSASRAISANQSPSRGPPPPSSAPPTGPPRDRSASSSREGVDSPPVSVKVKMHNDGRHVTLRRLSEAEAAAEREARRGRQQATGGAAAGSGSDNSEAGPSFRRATPGEREGTPRDELYLNTPPSAPTASPYQAATAAGPSELSSNYDSNRKRRRAERARAEQARQAKLAGASRVEFE